MTTNRVAWCCLLAAQTIRADGHVLPAAGTWSETVRLFMVDALHFLHVLCFHDVHLQQQEV